MSCYPVLTIGQPCKWEEPLVRTKSFDISKWTVWEAWKDVRDNGGSPGVDDVTIEDFEESLKSNLYKIWNRMSSGSYFPPPVRTVKIPKTSGGERALGIPTVGDRIAQMVVKRYLEPEVDSCFHQDSYGYRPNKSALDAVGVARKRCWRYDWVLDLDIKGFFDNIDHRLMLHAVEKHTRSRWILLYIERWLNASILQGDGELIDRHLGTPQGGVISPLLANIFAHHALDRWMEDKYTFVPFERYADDIVFHPRSKVQAQFLRQRIEERLALCKLKANKEKTKVVYCKDEDRVRNFSQESFDFLGFTFRPRGAKNRRGKFFVNFSPAISNRAALAIRETIRSWRIHRKSDKSIQDLSRMFNPMIRGWINYYGTYYKSATYPTLRYLNRRLVRWVQQKYKRYRHQRRATYWLRGVAQRDPHLFAHWKLGVLP